MSFSSWLRHLRSALAPGRGRPTHRGRGLRAATHRPYLEALEDRCLLSFSPMSNYDVGLAPQAVVAGRFNDDAFLDLAVANSSSNTVSVLLGAAGGTFQPAQNFATGAGPRSLAFGDFNADGMLDLVTANAADVSVLRGDGDGAFQPAVSIGAGLSPTSVAVGDFNGDGMLDLGVTSNIYTPGFYGYASGYYGGWYSYWNPGYYEGRANVLLGNGTGEFSDPSTTALGSGSHISAAVADFNGDGMDDFATLNFDYGTVSVLLGNVTGALGAPTNYTTGWYPRAVTVGDFTGDGILDLATAGQSVDVLPGYGDGTFRPVVRQYVDPVALAAADFNGDGQLDLVTANLGDVVSALLGTGSGSFRPAIDAAAGAGTAGVAVGDFNGDGRPDVASANSSSNNVSVLLNDGAWPAADAPSITIGGAATVIEGNTGTVSATFTVTLSAAYSQIVSVHYATTDYSATVAGGDYQAKTDTLTFGVGETSKTITVLVNGDRVAETSEHFLVHLSDPINAFVTTATGWGAIADDEPYVSISGTTVTEGNTGTREALFTVSLGSLYDVDVNVSYSTADGSAAAGSDFEDTTGTVTIPAGQTSQTVRVLVSGDRVAEQTEYTNTYYDYYGWPYSYTYFEDNEYFSVNLDSSDHGTIGNSQGQGVILDDEPRASIGGGGTVTEGNTGTNAVTFTVTLSAAYDAPVTVTYATADGSATSASGDYQAKTGTLTFGIGVTSQTVTALVNGDRIIESDEYFSVNLTGATGAHISNAWGSGTIRDDEPRVSINNASVTEGNTGTKSLTFTVTLSAAYDAPLTVTYATADGSATSASGDYQAKTGTLTFGIGVTSQTVTALVNGDRSFESNEYFLVNLTGAAGALITNGTGYGTIQDDEPRLSINSVSLKEGHSSTKVMKFTVTLSAVYDQTVTVKYATHDSSATVADNDYVATSGTLTFASGQTTKTFTVTIKGDRKKEANESFYVLLSGASSNALIENDYGWGAILNDDGR